MARSKVVTLVMLMVIKNQKAVSTLIFNKKFVTQGTKEFRENMGFQVLNVTQILIEKAQKRPKAFNFLIEISKIDA